MISWFLIVATMTISHSGVMADGKITIEPQTYRSESDCLMRVVELFKAAEQARAKGKSVPAQILACRGIALPKEPTNG